MIWIVAVSKVQGPGSRDVFAVALPDLRPARLDVNEIFSIFLQSPLLSVRAAVSSSALLRLLRIVHTFLFILHYKSLYV